MIERDPIDKALTDIMSLPPTERDKQNAQFTEIVQAFKTYYQKKSADNHFFKRIFFWAVIALLLLIAAGFAWVCYELTRNHGGDWKTALPVAAGSAVALVTALLKLPEIIATHLFPVGEDKVIVELVTALKDAEKR